MPIQVPLPVLVTVNYKIRINAALFQHINVYNGNRKNHNVFYEGAGEGIQIAVGEVIVGIDAADFHIYVEVHSVDQGVKRESRYRFDPQLAVGHDRILRLGTEDSVDGDFNDVEVIFSWKVIP